MTQTRISILLPDRLLVPTGGMGEQCRQVLRAFPEGYQFQVIGNRQDRPAFGRNFSYVPMEMAGLPVPEIDAWSANLLSQLPMFSTAINEAARGDPPDLVHAFDWSSFQAGVYLARHWDVPLVVTVQLSITKLAEDGIVRSDGSPAINIARGVEWQGLMAADHIVHVSRAYAARFPFGGKSSIVPNGVDPGEFDVPAAELPGRRPFKLIYIGRIDPMKGVQNLMAMRLPDEVDLIVIAGRGGANGPLADRLFAWGAGRGNVHMVGPKYGREKAAMLHAADAQIVPSLHEPFGIAALEALASRSLLLSSFAGGMADFLDRDTAIDCGAAPDLMAAAVGRAVRMTPGDRRERIERGLAVCRDYSWSAAATGLRTVYDRVLNRKEASC